MAENYPMQLASQLAHLMQYHNGLQYDAILATEDVGPADGDQQDIQENFVPKNMQLQREGI